MKCAGDGDSLDRRVSMVEVLKQDSDSHATVMKNVPAAQVNEAVANVLKAQKKILSLLRVFTITTPRMNPKLPANPNVHVHGPLPLHEVYVSGCGPRRRTRHAHIRGCG